MQLYYIRNIPPLSSLLPFQCCTGHDCGATILLFSSNTCQLFATSFISDSRQVTFQSTWASPTIFSIPHKCGLWWCDARSIREMLPMNPEPG
ncbi:hypothetical protein FPOAC1_010513 [Fusarium poae]|uniref:hypothetical protein n=1 Tax=Fusarium poae TaxID=36050 RepID=UPI001CEAAB6B|nr:hypothetical protein FPOAC1_010513 [Fusarium poae]KAG8665712.1 hypothetical protein FPOAC1_010513 [Fusarium poae]